MPFTSRAASLFLALTIAASAACSDATGPGDADALAGRWEGTSGAGVSYVYVFSAQGEQSPNPRTGNTAPVYSLAFTTTPGGTGTVNAWREGSTVYWGGSSLGTITDPNTLMVEADGLQPFPMHKQP